MYSPVLPALPSTAVCFRLSQALPPTEDSITLFCTFCVGRHGISRQQAASSARQSSIWPVLAVHRVQSCRPELGRLGARRVILSATPCPHIPGLLLPPWTAASLAGTRSASARSKLLSLSDLVADILNSASAASANACVSPPHCCSLLLSGDMQSNPAAASEVQAGGNAHLHLNSDQ